MSTIPDVEYLPRRVVVVGIVVNVVRVERRDALDAVSTIGRKDVIYNTNRRIGGSGKVYGRSTAVVEGVVTNLDWTVIASNTECTAADIGEDVERNMPLAGKA